MERKKKKKKKKSVGSGSTNSMCTEYVRRLQLGLKKIKIKKGLADNTETPNKYSVWFDIAWLVIPIFNIRL
jgi:hypothetical protein